MFDADAVGVGAAGMPGDIVVAHHLYYFAVLSDDIVGAHTGLRVLEPGDRAVDTGAAISDVNDDAVNGAGRRDRAEIARMGRDKTRCLRILRALFLGLGTSETLDCSTGRGVGYGALDAGVLRRQGTIPIVIVQG